MTPSRNRFYHDAAGDHSPTFLQECGPVLKVLIHVPTALAQVIADGGGSLPAPVAGLALIDTGASGTCVHEPVLRSLGLNPIGAVTSATAAGRTKHNFYPARLEFPGEAIDRDFNSVVGVDLEGQSVFLTTGDTPAMALIGRDVLADWILTYNGIGGFISISF